MSGNKAKATVEQVRSYHGQTKHHFHRTAGSPGYMDWANQPDPFRFYKGCPLVRLPLLPADPDADHDALFGGGTVSPRPISPENIAGMIELSMGLSAWKSIPGSTWSLRMNPSSGNLHPTESYWLLPGESGFAAGLYHYSPFLHALELRAEFPDTMSDLWRDHFGVSGFLVALSSIFWREAWKYGERAFRYCHHDIGHALAALRFSANLMGWHVYLLHGISDFDLARLLGFDRTAWVAGEEDEPDLLCLVCPAGDPPDSGGLSAAFIRNFDRLIFRGEPETLSRERRPWPIIFDVAEACRKRESAGVTLVWPDYPQRGLPPSPRSAAQLIRRRRSAVALDRVQSRMSREHFYGCLQATLPRRDHAPFDVGLGEPRVHLFIFVHHVDDLQPGLYALVRNPGHLEDLQKNTRSQFVWEKMDDNLPLYLLEIGDRREEARLVSCYQEIAGNGAFSLGMVARFRDVVEEAPYLYKHLFWESGMIGQVLYLQAEAYGLRGTGIGCFFDDPFHDILGLQDDRYQDLYHFTIGYPLEDTRLTTKPPYHHLQNLKIMK